MSRFGPPPGRMWRKGFLVERAMVASLEVRRFWYLCGSLFCSSQTYSVVHLSDINRFVFDPIYAHIFFTLPPYPLSPGPGW